MGVCAALAGALIWFQFTPGRELVAELAEPILVPRIETQSLILRGLVENDIPFLLDHFGKDEINKFTSDENVTSLEEARELYEKFIAPRPHLFRLGLVLKTSGCLIGTIGFYGIDRVNRRAIVGADLKREYWGKGLMSESLRALIRFGFNEMGLNRIEASTDPGNIHSIRLMERCGFMKEGVLRQRYYYKGMFHDDEIYSLLKNEWKD
jgi:ribosomal-protein-alanine N-acetyltransferase